MKFLRDASSAYRHAVDVLSQLVEEEGLDIAMRAYAEATADRTKEEYAGSYHVTQRSTPHVCIARLQGAKRCPQTARQTCWSPRWLSESPGGLPASDHLTEWVRDGKTDRIISQPYEVAYESLCHIVDFCARYSLQARLTACDSWHFPGATLLLTWERRDALE